MVFILVVVAVIILAVAVFWILHETQQNNRLRELEKQLKKLRQDLDFYVKVRMREKT